jgi:hypothetical protein
MTRDDLLKLAATEPRKGTEQIGDQTVHLAGLTAGQLQELRTTIRDDDALDMNALIVAKALREENGSPMFGDVLDAARKLMGLPAQTLARLVITVDRLSDVEPGTTAALLGNSQERTAA